jgi:hypothetical protein
MKTNLAFRCSEATFATLSVTSCVGGRCDCLLPSEMICCLFTLEWSCWQLITLGPADLGPAHSAAPIPTVSYPYPCLILCSVMAYPLAPILNFFKPQPPKPSPAHHFGIQVLADGVDPVVEHVYIGCQMLDRITDSVSLALSLFMAWMDTR